MPGGQSIFAVYPRDGLGLLPIALAPMPIDVEFLLNANREQAGSEVDLFTVERYRQFEQFLPESVLRVLDVGGGVGRGGAELKRLRPELSLAGVDCVPERVEVMHKEIYDEAVCAFANHMPFENGSYDAIIAGEFIEHVPGHLVDPTLQEFFRVLTLKGRLLLTTPNPHYLRNKLQGLSVISEPSHVSQHYPEVLRLRLKMAGFSRVAIRGSGKVSRFVGTWAPLPLYGSYLCVATKW